MRLRTSLLVTPFLLWSATALADSMTCGSQVVSEGDSVSSLLEHCGEPDQREGVRWYYRINETTTRVVHVEGGEVTLIETEHD